MPACCFLDVLKTIHPEEMEGDRNGGCMDAELSTFTTPSPEGDVKQFSLKQDRKTLVTLLIQLEETEEQIDSLQQLRSDLLKEIASTQQHILLES